MKLNNTKKSWGAVAQGLHWLIFILIAGQLIAGLIMTDMENGDDKWAIYGLHKSFGLIVLLFIIARIVWRIRSLIPDEAAMPKWQAKVAETVILILYFFMVMIPVSGIVMSLKGGHPIGFFNLFTIPAFEKNEMLAGIANEAHSILAWGLVAALALHIGAAFYHHFKLKDDVLRRMLPGYKD